MVRRKTRESNNMVSVEKSSGHGFPWNWPTVETRVDMVAADPNAQRTIWQE
jgi:hypothetical protein